MSAKTGTAEAGQSIACVACGGEMTFVRKMPSLKSSAILDLYFCGGCETAAMPFERERTDEIQRRSVGFHETIVDRNIGWSDKLFRLFGAYSIKPRTVIEIGCGSGATLDVALKHGVERAIGYEMNPYVTEYGRGRFPAVEFRDELWTSQSDPQGAELVLCLSVLEHINDPRHLLGEFARYCMAADGFLALSVPIFNPDAWGHVMNPLAKGSPFRSAEEHVLHFSQKGFRTILRKAGAKRIRAHHVGGWSLHLVAFSDGAADRLEAMQEALDYAPRLKAPRPL